MREKFDFIVVGVGGMGSATCYHLSKRGHNVLGLESSNVPNSLGSSHGETRIIRKGYFEGEHYVSILERAYELWEELEDESGQKLLHKTGLIAFGEKGTQLVDNTIESCKKNNFEHEELAAEELNERFPGYELPEDYKAVLEPEGGFLESEKCIMAHVIQAQKNGAEIHAQEKVENWESEEEGVKIETDRGSYRANKLVFAAGAWTPKLIASVSEYLQVDLHSLTWEQPERPQFYRSNNFPPFIADTEEGQYYGFPHHERPGFKYARFKPVEQKIDPETVERQPEISDAQRLSAFSKKNFKAAKGDVMAIERCLQTDTPDRDFIIDKLPDCENLVVGAGFSGHGFKMSSAIGEILADLAEKGETRFEIEEFRISRFQGK